MFIEFHVIQNFVPSNLNRGETGSPKDCKFGGFRRARISSQCTKKSIRDYAGFAEAITNVSGDIGIRTKRLTSELSKKICEKPNVKKLPNNEQKNVADRVAQNIVKCLGLGFPTDSNTEEIQNYEKTQYLLFLGKEELDDLAEIATDDPNWFVMSQKIDRVSLTDSRGNPKSAKVLKDERRKLFTDANLKEILSEQEAPKNQSDAQFKKIKGLQRKLKGVVRKERLNKKSFAADISLFGRMVADDKNMNVNAACQVAHAISTNEVEMKMDFFTAIDDLLPDDTSGSDMMGIVDFNSSCYYRYAQINLDVLKHNLGCPADLKKKSEIYDPEIVKAAVGGFFKGMVEAVPTGMQNSMAHYNPPSYVRVLVRSSGASWNLANAFIQPIRAGKGEGEDLINKSVHKLENYFDDLKKVFGNEGIDNDFICSLNLVDRKKTDITISQAIEKLKGAISDEVKC